MEINDLKQMVCDFRDNRNWRKYHTPKNLAQALASEIGELNDLYLWDRKPSHAEVKKEVADILIFLLSFADVVGINLCQAVISKIAENNIKYPIEKAKDNAQKYTKL